MMEKYEHFVMTEQGKIFVGSAKMCNQVYNALWWYQKKLKEDGILGNNRSYVLIGKCVKEDD